MKRFIIATTALLFTIPAIASAGQYRDLCSSAPGACEYTGPDAPWLDADVCWSETGSLTLKGGQACPAGSWAYHLDYGEVIDPVTSRLVGYAPLDWACDYPGLCVSGPVPPDTKTTSQAICCEWGDCYPLNQSICNSAYSYALVCYDGVSNEDGTITCFEGQPV